MLELTRVVANAELNSATSAEQSGRLLENVVAPSGSRKILSDVQSKL